MAASQRMLIRRVQRFGLALVTCSCISIPGVVIIRLPPDVVTGADIASLAAGGSIPAGQADALRRDGSLKQPFAMQYANSTGRVLPGDPGLTMVRRRPLAEVIGTPAPDLPLPWTDPRIRPEGRS